MKLNYKYKLMGLTYKSYRATENTNTGMRTLFYRKIT